MCGFLGSFAFADAPVGVVGRDVRTLLPRLARRGPDDEGFWTDDRCALGFRRLSILDLSSEAAQPMVSPDGRHIMVFNGEIYNFLELREQLQRDGEHFRTTGDAEVLLRAISLWGPEALARVNGMFALAVYDRIERSLLLARDHAGIKPLYFGASTAGVVFGSQYRDIKEHPWNDSSPVSSDALALYLRLGFVPSPFALHSGCAQVEPGSFIRFAVNSQSGGTFYQLPRATSELKGAEALDAFDKAFTRAVKRHLIADVSVGVLLSGGIDSPLVAAEAGRQQPGIKLFTIASDHERHDEGAAARAYAANLGGQHVVETIRAADAVHLIDDVISACSEPTSDYSMFPMLMVSALARRDVKVVLSGDGGDELYWGYADRFASAIRQARYFSWPRIARFAAVAARRVGRGTASGDVIKHDSLGDLYLRKHSVLSADDLGAVFEAPPAVPAQFDAFSCRATDIDEAAHWVRENEFRIHLARVLMKVDRASMFHSVEVRVPLLDREVIDVAWRTDWRTCLDIERRTGKRILREALSRRLGHQTPGKRGFGIPMYDWLLGPLRTRLHDLLFERRELLGLPLKRGGVKRLYEQLQQGNRGKAWGLWTLMSLAAWDQPPAERPS